MTQYSPRAMNLARKLNQTRHEQAKQIDILCNDMVSAHSDFISQLRMLNFSVKFYESVLGQSDSSSLLQSAAGQIQGCVNHSSIAIYLTQTQRFECHLVNADFNGEMEKERLEGFFTPDVTQGICRTCAICSLQDLFGMQLDESHESLAKISGASVPLGQIGDCGGFVLVYRYAESPLTKSELQRVASVMPGLNKAVKSCLRAQAGASAGAA